MNTEMKKLLIKALAQVDRDIAAKKKRHAFMLADCARKGIPPLIDSRSL